MSAAEDRLKSGDLDGALADLTEEIKKAPQVARSRVFLFQLLCIKRDWERALRQLKLSAELDAEAVAMAKTYREAIVCEVYREAVFRGEKEPLIFGEPEDWLALLVEAQKMLAAGNPKEAAELRARAFDDAPARKGVVNGTEFEWIADADMRFGPVFEIILNGRYFWVPQSAVASIRVDEPADLRDRVWMPIDLLLANGGKMVGLIPTRYPGGADDPALLLSRETRWSDAGAETYVGEGQRLFATDTGDVALMDVRALTFEGGLTQAQPGAEEETPDV